MSITEFANKLQCLGKLNLINMDIDNNMDTYHNVKHSFREVLIVPYLGVSQNLAFLTGKGKKFVTTADNIKCEVVRWKELHICDMEKDVQEIYHTDSWSFVKRWYAYEKGMDSMHFIKMELKKIEEDE